MHTNHYSRRQLILALTKRLRGARVTSYLLQQKAKLVVGLVLAGGVTTE